MLEFDIESDGLLDTVSVIHCINVIDKNTGKKLAYNPGIYKDGSPAPRDGTIEDGLKALEEADGLAGQNIIDYDIPAIKKLYPKFKPRGLIFDTKVASRVIWADLKDRDFNAIRRGTLPSEFQKKGLIGKHSLESWGYRLGVHKGDFNPGDYIDPETGKPHTWATIGFTQEMDEYGRQDPVVTLKWHEKIESKNYSQECLELEHAVAQILFRQHERGFCFDIEQAHRLTAKLQKRHAEISDQLLTVFQPWFAPDIKAGSSLATPKKKRREWIEDENGPKKRLIKGVVVWGHYREFTEGVPYTRIKHVVFNPASRDHIADRLMKLRSWKPTQFTDGGKPQVDESTLDPLPWPEAKILTEYLMIEKRLGQVATGKEAWLRHAVKTGIYGKEGPHYRIHGSVNTNGAVTGRMTHAWPNVAQTPAVGAAYGEDCRACYIATPGLVLVGCDAEGLELRCLAHFMAKYDDGAYVQVVVNGKKEDGSDVHTVNKNAAGLNLRDSAKTFIYALIYGAGDYKLGTIAYDDFTEDQRTRFNTKYPTKRTRQLALKNLGTAKRARLMKNLPALGQLVEAVKKAVRKNGHLRGLDGRLLHVRAEHSALNTLLQSAGAIVMKRGLVDLDEQLNTFRSAGHEVHFVANIHDEWQIETNKEISEDVGRIAADAIRRAGEHYKFRCPLSGSFGIGNNWAATH